MKQARKSRAPQAVAASRVRTAGGRVAPPADLAPALARVVGWRPNEGFLVVPADRPASPARLARSTVRLTETEARAAVACDQEVLIAFARSAPDVPIIVGLLQAPAVGQGTRPAEVILDGDRVVLRGTREVELRCGKASVLLKEDGLVVVKGATVETRALGVNRIRGGAVKIN